MSPPTTPSAVPFTARLAVTAVFFLNGVVIATWVVRIPAVQEKLGLGEGLLGVSLLGAGVGALVAMPLTGALTSRFGSRPVVGATALMLPVALVLPALAPGLLSLVVALVLFGASNGALDVSMNAQAVVVEKEYGRPIMSSFHAAFSFGGLTGAVVGGLIAAGVETLLTSPRYAGCRYWRRWLRTGRYCRRAWTPGKRVRRPSPVPTGH